MKRIRISISILISLLLALMVYAESGILYTADKLPSSMTNCVVQDRYGFIWVGTEYGLSRFDGYKFTNYKRISNDSTSIIDNIITSFLVDKDGKLWIGCAKGLMSYDYEHDNFVRYKFVDSRKPRPRIYSLLQYHNGDILAGTAGFGLFKLMKGTTTFKCLREVSHRTYDNYYAHTYEDAYGNIWRSSHLSVFTCYTQRGNKYIIRDFTSPFGPPVEFLRSKTGNLIIVCTTGILSYDYKTRKVSVPFLDMGPYKDNISINSATFDHAHNLYIGTAENGVLVIRNGSHKLVELENEDINRFSLRSAYINDIMEDKDHNLWICCNKKGLYLINQRKAAFHSWSFSSQNYVIGSGVSSIASGDNGQTWCIVQNSGVFCFDKSGKIIAHPASPAGASIIYRDKKGQFWLGTGNTLFAYNPSTGASIPKLKFVGQGIYCMTDDGNGKLYLSVYSKGLYIYDIASGSVKVIAMDHQISRGYLCNDWVRSLCFGNDGLLWIGTSNGVACMNTSTFNFRTYGWNSILREVQTNYICQGNNGNIIIGTDEGLYQFSTTKRALLRFPGSSSLRDKQICGIVRDSKGDLWVSTTMGIWQYDKSIRQFIGHVSGNGLTQKEYSLCTVIHTPDDMIGFGTSDGITTFYPSEVKANSMMMGDVYLTNFILDGKPISVMHDLFEIPYTENSFSMEFSLLDYMNTDNISFEYRLNGSNWIATNEGSNSISFNKLKPGKYVIQVRAVNNGIYSKGVRKITVIVSDPWFATPLAYLVYALIATAIVLFFIRMYVKRRKQELEEAKMRFLINATHDIRSPLTLIMGPLHKLKSKITDQESRVDIDIIDRNARRLLLLVNQILDERKIDKDQMRLHCQETDLVEYIQTICALYSYNAGERNITFSFTHEDDKLMAWIDRINFDKVVNNLLSNAFKYTFDGGVITVMLSHNDKNATIQVVDTGIGFKDEKPERLFERFYQGENTDKLHIEGTGIGLNLSRALVQMHGGKIKASNRNDGEKGACITVTLPLGNAHLKPEEIMEDEEQPTDEAVATVKKQSSKNIRIMIVDDDKEIGQYIKNELDKWYRFDCFTNGKEALETLLNGKYDLVISDVMMPVMDGITLLKKIKSNINISHIPVILLTSKADISDRLEGLKKGADAYLAKPFNMEELHILIDNLVDNLRRLRGKFSGIQEQEGKVEDVEVKGNDDALMERIMKSINENLSDPDFNVEKLTEDVGISRAQLHRKMKEIAGISTGEFIRNLRLEQAARLIRENKINVTQVAYSVGFNNQTHFSTVFKKHFGLSPSEYAEKKGQQQENE
jgi:signal transduction histidine kinase/ligand-binding sensor domain-containing protein/DNA-binding response OmpR family regulator